jgi:hypothetical protein
MKRVLLVILMMLVAACSSTTSSGGGTTVANPPTLPQNSLSPDFDQSIYEESLGSETTEATDLSQELIANSNDTTARLTGPASFWTDTVTAGPVKTARILRRRFESLASVIMTAINSDPTFALSATPSTVTLTGRTFFTITGDWRLSISIRDSTHIKVVIRAADDMRIWGYYLFDTDSDGNPIRGAFAFVNVDALALGSEDAFRFFSLSYDFSDSSINRLALTAELFDSDLNLYSIQHDVYQCDPSTRDCVGEFLRISTAPPTREFNARSVRVGWNDTSHEVCAATISYDSAAHLGTTQSFIGPAQPGDGDVSEGTCTINTPFWQDRVFAPSNFPDRFEDDSDGGFSEHLFGTGTNLTTWEDVITGDTPDDWLEGQF